MKIKEIEKRLALSGIDNAQGEAYLIIERLFSLNRYSILLDTEREFCSPELDSLIEKRCEGEPLQYLFGEWEFMGKEFYVSKDCLIPRADTEILVEKAIQLLKKGGEVADLCTGSGCIGISVAVYRPDIKSLTLADISEGALKMAEKNVQRHCLGEKTTLLLCDITKNLPNKKYDMIVSNPPYIPRGDIDTLSSEVKKEPRLALDGGEDGLDIIRFLLSKGLDYLNENGQMLIEFGYDQEAQMRELLDQIKTQGRVKSYEILYDYSKNPRVAVVYV